MISLPYILLSILWFSLIAYAVFGGADFGAGVWDLLAFGPDAQEQHDLIDQALGPVWETNHVWLIFLVVGLFSAFPAPFAVLVTVLYVPLTLALIGVALRGSAFVFRTHGLRTGKAAMKVWTRVFSFSSIITPFFLGLAAATVAGGQIRVQGGVAQANLGAFVLTPFALTIGFMAIALCATLAAIFLTVEATNNNKHVIAEAFRWRGLIAGAITAILGALGLLLAPSAAPILWQGMLAHALPVVIATMIIGIATAVTLFFRYFQIARALIVAETAFLLGSWGVSQIPYLIPPDVTVDAGAGPPSTLLLMLIGVIIGMIIILPSIWYLFYIFKLRNSMGLLEKERP
jgi:cytochrome d ubiquinol oxidase subunit II